MMGAEQVEELICLVSAMDRAALMEQFRCYNANFPIDFTADFLEAQSVDRLRHILLAVCLQTKRLPSVQSTQAA